METRVPPSAVARTRPVRSPYWARFRSASGVILSGTRTVAPAGTVTERAPRLATPERTVDPSLPVTPWSDSLNFTGLSVVLVYGTSTVVRSEESCGQPKEPPCTAGEPSTFWSIAALASSRPPPVSPAVPGTALSADDTRAALIRWALQSGWRCLTRAAAPATCGVAIDVPLMDWYA